MTMPSDDLMSKAVTVAARRMEVFTGAGRRREWSAEHKATIVAESYVGDVSASDVAKRHGLTLSQLFAWRREARHLIASSGGTEEDFFVPAVVDAVGKNAVHPSDEEPPLIGFDLDGASVWIGRGADARMVKAIIRALKSTR